MELPVLPQRPLLAVNVGNSRVAIARVDSGRMHAVFRVGHQATEPGGEVTRAVIGEWNVLCEECGEAQEPIAIVASVRDAVAGPLMRELGTHGCRQVLLAERDVTVPIGRCLDPEAVVGVDRLLNTAAAFDSVRQACIVIDAGTAVTVDFIDGEGTFHGGAIAPGARAQLQAMHRHGALLPDLELRAPGAQAWGSNTAEAMLRGVCFGIRGMARYLIERYSEQYGAYPRIIATGGDARLLFEDDELIENIVDDLTLYGIGITYRTALEQATISQLPVDHE